MDNHSHFRQALERVKPGEAAKQRMLEAVLAESGAGKKARPRGRWVAFAAPAAAAVLLIAGAAVALHARPVPPPIDETGGAAVSSSGAAQTNAAPATTAVAPQPTGDNRPTTTITTTATTKKAIGTRPGDKTTIRDDAEIAVIEKKDEFGLGGRYYTKARADQLKEYGLPATIAADKAGERLGVIDESIDDTLLGCAVYRYGETYGDWAYAVERGGRLELFLFSGFASQFAPGRPQTVDRGAAELLDLYGADSAAAVSAVELLYWENDAYHQRTVYKDAADIQTFYDLFRGLREDSQGYMDAITEVGRRYYLEDMATTATTVADPKAATTRSQAGFVGYGHYAFMHSTEIRLRLHNGYVFPLTYYPRMQYLSSYPLTADQNATMEYYCKGK